MLTPSTEIQSVTSTCGADCNESPACRQSCLSARRSILQVDTIHLATRIEQINWLAPPLRADLLDRITGFIGGQLKRIQALFGLGSSPTDAAEASLCGSDDEIAAARAIIDTSVGVLLLPKNSQGFRPSDVIVYRQHVAASTMRYAERRARQAIQKFAEDAQRVASPFQVTANQVSIMLARHDTDANVKAMDPHGNLRRRWQDIRTSQTLVSECQAASECLEQFALDHKLTAMEGVVA